MSVNASAISPDAAVPRGPLPRGVSGAAARSRRLERRVALVSIVAPFLGTVVAIVSLWGYAIGPRELGLLAVMYSISVVGLGLGYHRYFSHASFQTSAAGRALLAILGSISAEGPPLYWAAIHRRHHQFSDRPGDPHSPNLHGDGVGGLLRGLWHAHTGWLFVHESTDWSRWVPDLLRDRMLFRINQLYFLWIALGLAIPAAIGGALSGTLEGAALGFLWGSAVRIFLVHHMTWSVNSISHVWGARPYESRDSSCNNPLIAVMTFGDGWHNNHHAFPTSAFHGLEWWEIDVTNYLILALEATGLIWKVNHPPEKARRRPRRVESWPNRPEVEVEVEVEVGTQTPA